MLLNWNPSKDELLKLSNDILDKISFIYNGIHEKGYILQILRKENIIFSNVYNYFAFMHDITDKPEIKNICNKIISIIMKKKDTLFSSKEIYDKVNTLLKNIKDLSKEDIRFIKYLSTEFKKNGITHDNIVKKNVLNLKEKILFLQNEYNICIDNEPIFILNKDESNGLNEIFLEKYMINKNMYSIPLNEHTYNYLLENLEKTYMREKIQKYYFGNYKKNYKILKQLIITRNNLTEILGFENFIDYVNKYQTFNSNKKINEFINQLNTSINNKYIQEMKSLCEHFNMPKIKNVYQLNSWDLPYLINKYKKEKFNINYDEINQYFPINYTLQQILKIFETTFNIKIIKYNHNHNEVWNPSVIIYNIQKNDTIIGDIYFDIYNRPGKTSGSSTSTIKEPLPKEDIDGEFQKGIVCIMTNFPVYERNNCFNLTEISILIHEITHGLHIIMGKCKYTFLCSNNIEYSFIETFPQLTELWLHNKNFLKFISNHYITNQTLSDTLIDRIILSNKSLRTISIKQQIFLSLLDNLIYNKKTINLLKTEDQHHRKILNEIFYLIYNNIFNNDDINISINIENNPLLVFNHISSSYAGQYYGYIWSDYIANTLFTMIQNKHININKLIDIIISANHFTPTQIINKLYNIK
jgi:Zn-dependent oligopeptidase